MKIGALASLITTHPWTTESIELVLEKLGIDLFYGTGSRSITTVECMPLSYV